MNSSTLQRVKIGLALLTVGSFVYLFVISRHIDTTLSEQKVLKQRVGLKVNGVNFTFEGEPFRIMSGAIHYFRVPRDYWDDRILKAKAMGLNTVETYIPWNMHEPKPGVYNFEGDLSLSNFIALAQIYGLYVIIRPGPYICAEWDLGGLPSWLLRDPDMRLRSSYKPFLDAVDRYFDRLMPILERFQYSSGGPVIAFQIENEYGSFGTDLQYMKHLKKAFIKRGIKELLFTSDNAGGLGKVPLKGVLKTINLQTDVDAMINQLEKEQPNTAVLVTEFWSGWFDHWGEKHHVVELKTVETALKRIMNRNASFNLYMFHGGTNFGFMNGANAHSKGKGYLPTISSYDYDAPVAETGDLTKKYHALKKIILQNAQKGSVSDRLPWIPDSTGRTLYGKIKLESYMPLKDILRNVKNSVDLTDVLPMEMLPINDNAGQSYGYVLYSTTLTSDAKEVTIIDAADRVTVILNNEVLEKVTTLNQKHIAKLPELQAGRTHNLQILVENCGRINYESAIDDQRKGIRGRVDVNNRKKTQWKVFPLEFKRNFVKSLEKNNNWKKDIPKTIKAPAVYRGTLWVRRAPHDAILHIEGFDRGVVFINGRNLGRYDKAGPQKTLYIPRMFLKSGENTVIMFEQGKPSPSLEIDTVSDLIFGKSVEFEI